MTNANVQYVNNQQIVDIPQIIVDIQNSLTTSLNMNLNTLAEIDKMIECHNKLNEIITKQKNILLFTTCALMLLNISLLYRHRDCSLAHSTN